MKKFNIGDRVLIKWEAPNRPHTPFACVELESMTQNGRFWMRVLKNFHGMSENIGARTIYNLNHAELPNCDACEDRFDCWTNSLVM